MGWAPKHLLRVLAVLALAAPLFVLGDSAPAACAAPQIEVGREVVRPGEELVVTGKYWWDGCDDSGGSSGGCGGSEDPGESMEPTADIPVSLWEGKGSLRSHAYKGREPIEEWVVDGPNFTIRIATDGLELGGYTVSAAYETVTFSVVE